MPIVFASAASHAPGITAWAELAPAPQREKVLGAYHSLQEGLARAKPDVLVAITVEHWANFFLDNIPPFCLGRADHYKGPIEPWLKIPPTQMPGDRATASAILDEFYDAGVDMSFSDELLFDHATMLPLHFLVPGRDVPVIPLIINALTPPMPTAKRCYEMGNLLGKILDHQTQRVAVVATGGLSHWPGEPRAGEINTEFDEEFLAHLTRGETDALSAYTHAEIALAGGGAHEVRTWIALAGAVSDWQAEVLAYEPVVPWATGCGFVHFTNS